MITPNLIGFLKVLGGTASLLALAYVGLELIANKTWIEQNGTILFFNGLYWLVIPPLLFVAYNLGRQPDGFASPKVRQILDDGILLIDPCDWLGHQTYVAIYMMENEFEKLLAVGIVINIQTNGFIQVKLNAPERMELKLGTLKENRSSLKIKPGVMT